MLRPTFKHEQNTIATSMGACLQYTGRPGSIPMQDCPIWNINVFIRFKNNNYEKMRSAR